MRGYRREFTHLSAASHEGALVLVDGVVNDDDLALAARLTARFSQGRDCARVTVTITDKHGASRQLEVAPLLSDEIPADWYL